MSDVALLKDWLMWIVGFLLIVATFLVGARAVFGEPEEDEGQVTSRRYRRETR